MSVTYQKPSSSSLALKPLFPTFCASLLVPCICSARHIPRALHTQTILTVNCTQSRVQYSILKQQLGYGRPHAGGVSPLSAIIKRYRFAKQPDFQETTYFRSGDIQLAVSETRAP
ncbi:hypothetical protein J6590_069340 [Homalodisca vitripennis]|nr:hypothetical protein J6590_069340 [Homalodisca vitripennis]